MILINPLIWGLVFLGFYVQTINLRSKTFYFSRSLWLGRIDITSKIINIYFILQTSNFFLEKADHTII